MSTVDACDFYELNLDPEVIKYTGDQDFGSIEEAEKFLENYKAYEKNGFGRWAVIEKGSSKFVGWCGLKLNEENLIDIGFRFKREDWGKGYATESAKACLKYGFEELNLKLIIARTSKQNYSAQKVLEKIGMIFWKRQYCEGIGDTVYYNMENRF